MAINTALKNAAPQKNQTLSDYVAESDLENDNASGQDYDASSRFLSSSRTGSPSLFNATSSSHHPMSSDRETAVYDQDAQFNMGSSPFATPRKRKGFQATVDDARAKRAKLDAAEPYSYVEAVKDQKKQMELQKHQLEEAKAKREKLELDIQQKRVSPHCLCSHAGPFSGCKSHCFHEPR
jgi:hypothetical protein